MAVGRRKQDDQTILPESVTIFLHRRMEELAASILFLAGIYLLVSLLTYDVSDPSLNTAVDGPSHNLGGLLGAQISDFFVQGFGWASFVLAIILFSWGRVKFVHKPLNRLWLKILLLPFLVCSLSLVLALLTPGIFYAPVKIGGAIGQIFAINFQAYLFFLGQYFAWVTVLFLSAVTFIGLFIYTSGIRGNEWQQGYAFITSFIKLFQHWTKFASKDEPALAHQKARTHSPSFEDRPIKSSPKETISFKTDNAPVSSSPQMKISVEREVGAEEIFEEEEDMPLDLDLNGDYQLPSLELLSQGDSQDPAKFSETELKDNALRLKEVLEDFGVRGDITNVRPGPVVTLYELIPAPGIKSSRVIGLADDIARSMSAVSARVAVIPGRNVIGIELPNETRLTVFLRDLLSAGSYERTGGSLPLALGKEISGSPIIADLARMPHLLVAGTTGSGKSVCINSMILSLLYRLPPDRCKLIMIDPKMLELSVYDGIPHLLSPVVTDPKKAVVALKWTVREMENRYKSMSKLGVRNIIGYNVRIAEAKAKGESLARKVQTGFDSETGRPIYETQALELEPLPYIVVIVDEMADLMLVAGKDIEAAVQRLAQMARAAGIHLIMATQRPSVDVITGTIKANFPTRISFQVTSKIDSRTILGEQGAEQLLGMGDMLYMMPGGRITRVHGPFVSDQEVESVVRYLKTQGYPDYLEDITEEDDETTIAGTEGEGSGDELYDQAVALIMREGKVSTSFIQRHLQIGYNRAARIVEKMEEEGIVSPASRTGKREILIGNAA